MNLDQLKSKIEGVIKTDNFDIEKLKDLLTPISAYVEHPTFIKNIVDVVTIIIQDRNGDMVFNLDDLKILANDNVAISSLVSSVLLVICAIPELKFKYSQGATEELVFKLLAFVFLVIVPTQVKRQLTKEEKGMIVNYTLIIYNTIRSSQMVKDIVDKIITYFKTHDVTSCLPTLNCCAKKPTPEEILEKRLPAAKLNLEHSITNVRHIAVKEREKKEREIKEKTDKKVEKKVERKSSKK